MSLNLDKSTWNCAAFGDIIESVTERVDNPSEAGVERYVGLEHLDPGVLTVQRWDSPEKVEAQKLRFHPGDVIFGRRRAYQKKVARADFEGICSAHALVLRARPGRIHPEFLPVFLSSDYFLDRAIAISVGSLSPTINWRDLRAVEFGFPTLHEQKRIADLVWAVEEHRQALKSTVGHLTAARTQLLAEALAKGCVKDGWSVEQVSRLVKDGPRNGKSFPANDEARGIPTLSISAVRDGQVRGGSSVKYIDVPADTVQSYLLEPDDFLVVRGNGNKQLTARGGLVTSGLPEGCIYPDLLVRLRFDDRVILPSFAAAQWNSPGAHRRLLQNAKSTNGIWKINGQDIKSHELITPPIPAQQALLDQLKRVDSSTNLVREQSAALGALRSSLLADIFGGL